jgi:hypothetical protein
MYFYSTLIVLLASAAASSAVGTEVMRTAEQCGVDIEQPALKVFANFDGVEGWREYKNVKEIPPLSPGFGSAAFYWTGHNGNSLIQLQEPSEDFSAYTHYCFDRSGHLTRLRYELRTAWGWGFREEGLIKKGNFQVETSEFFDTKTEQPIHKPEMADEIPEALKPRLYLIKSKLPFSRLLPK